MQRGISEAGFGKTEIRNYIYTGSFLTQGAEGQPWHSSAPVDFVILGFGILREALGISSLLDHWLQGNCVT